MEGLRGKEALVQAVVKNIARKEAKEPETRSDDEIRAALRVKGEQTVKVCRSSGRSSYCYGTLMFRFFSSRERNGPLPLHQHLGPKHFLFTHLETPQRYIDGDFHVKINHVAAACFGLSRS